MERLVGTVSRGVRAPIIREGDDLAKIVVDSVLAAGKSEGFSFHDRDVVAVTEAVVARAQGNYAHINDIAADVKNKLGGETIGVIFPILSRNRFSVCLKGIARGAKKVVLMLSFPADEVGNHLIDEELLDEVGRTFKRVVTVEDGSLRGGVGEAVAAFFNRRGYQVEVHALGVGDAWVEHGTPAQLYALCGYDEEAILRALLGR